MTSLTTGASSAPSVERLDVELLLLLEDLEVGVSAASARSSMTFFSSSDVVGAVVVVDGGLDGDLGGHDRLDVVAGHELDVVHGEDVRRVGHRDRDRGAGLVDREDVVLARDVGRDELDDARVDLEVGEVDRRDAELLRETLGDVVLGDEAELDQGLAELSARVLLELEGLLELILCDQAGFGQQFAETYAHFRRGLRSRSDGISQWQVLIGRWPVRITASK